MINTKNRRKKNSGENCGYFSQKLEINEKKKVISKFVINYYNIWVFIMCTDDKKGENKIHQKKNVEKG